MTVIHWKGWITCSQTFVGMIVSEMLTFIIWPIVHHSHPLSSLVIFLSLFILWEWMIMQTTAKSFLSLLLRAGDVHLGGHVLPAWRPSKVISLPWICSCMKPKNRRLWRFMSLYSAVLHATIALNILRLLTWYAVVPTMSRLCSSIRMSGNTTDIILRCVGRNCSRLTYSLNL